MSEFPAAAKLIYQGDKVSGGEYATWGDGSGSGGSVPPPQVDMVNHPPHYNSHPSGIECIEIVRHHNFDIGNAIKYLWRAGLKDEDTLTQDLEKAIFYIKDEIERLKKAK